MKSSDIVIVGAGPTGLMLANQLTRLGIEYIILDQKSGPTDQSRALVVHARSMEIYEQLGLSDQIVNDGQKNDGINFYKDGKLAASVTIVNSDETASPFPYLMMYEQSKNEHLLYGNLVAHAKEVMWDTSINSIVEEKNQYKLDTTQGGKELIINCKYLIACDGSKSIVRDFAKVAFKGGSYENVFFVADTHVKGEKLSDQKLSLFLTRDDIGLLFPMTGEKHFRALGILPTVYYHKADIAIEEILGKVKEGMKMPVEFYDTGWHSTYRLHHKKVECFSKGNIFFAGDAAHVHSPMGGQGMNTGLQDVYNLAWKLALVQKGKASPLLLNTYHEERNPIAEALLKSTDRLFSTMSKAGFWHGIFRLYFVPMFVPLITSLKRIRSEMFRQISQIAIHYKSSSLARGTAGKISAGARLPYCQVMENNAATSLYKLMDGGKNQIFKILVYNLPSFQAELFDKALFSARTIQRNDYNARSLGAVGLPLSFMIIVRPDNYIGYISQNADMQEANAFFRNAYFMI